MYLRDIVPPLTPEEILDYLRKSQSDDPLLTVEEVLEKHETLLDEWAVKNLGAKVPEENKFREIVSGETLKERPEITKVLRLIESPRYRAVKIVEPQRLTRGDLEDIGRLMKLLKHTNTYVITMDRIYDLRDEYDWNAFEGELKRGNDYLMYYKKIQERGRLLSVAAGNFLGSIPPYGYKKIKIKDGKRECPTLEEIPEEADVVRLIFDLYVNEDMGYKKICNRLEELKIKPPKGQYWSPASVIDMLGNVHYIGKVRWNWRKTLTIVEESEFLKTRPRAKIGEYLIYEGKHNAIVSEELFNAAQEKQGKNPRVKGRSKMVNPFAGLIFCECGHAIVYKEYKHKDGTPKSAPRLLCRDQAHCGNGSCTFEEIYTRICQVLEQCIDNFEIRMQNNESDSIKLHVNLIKNLEKKLIDLQAKELKQWELQSDPDEAKRMPEHIFKQLNEKLLKEKQEVQEALCKARESMPAPVDYEVKQATFKDALEALQNPEAEAELKNKLLRKCIDRITYKREKPTRGKGVQYTNWTAPPIELDVELRV